MEEEKKQKHSIAIGLLHKELYRVGGEIFEHFYTKEMMKALSESGNEEAIKQLDMAETMKKVLGIGFFSDPENELEERLLNIVRSIKILSDDSEDKENKQL